ncbi:hypothetical protein AOQ84DRAFT_218076 [Glonium stellatum]|uniref:FAR-17a/AIG1-like protein n=1 Tax=Glonium stellatum TaxID=574774 RepID=A0A8E2JLJ8_9PEZI|nr:hypothetical protein AOQ84DRAFT_218076 [Glonium stellatum]
MSASKVAEELSRRHPLQRLESPSRGISAVLHAIGLVSYALSFKYLVDHPNIINESYGWHMQYLTIIGLSLATATFASGLLADLTLSTRLFSLKNGLAVTAAPLEVLISILYWGLRIIDPALVMPTWAPPLETSADLGFHFAPAFLLTLDLLLLSPPWPSSTLASAKTLVISTAFAFAYWFWVELCYTHNGFYPYPLFTALSTPWRVALFAFSGVLMTASAFGLRATYGWVNGVEMRKAKAT